MLVFFRREEMKVNPEDVEEENDTVEEPEEEPEPIDVRAFIDEKRRHAEDEALRVANMLAEEYYGVLESVDVPDDLGSTLFFNAPRVYRVSTGSMRFTIFSRPRQNVPSHVDSITDATEYEKSVARTKDLSNCITIHVAALGIDNDTGEIQWNYETLINRYIKSENDIYKIREQFYPTW